MTGFGSFYLKMLPLRPRAETADLRGRRDWADTSACAAAIKRREIGIALGDAARAWRCRP